MILKFDDVCVERGFFQSLTGVVRNNKRPEVFLSISEVMEMIDNDNIVDRRKRIKHFKEHVCCTQEIKQKGD